VNVLSQARGLPAAQKAKQVILRAAGED
jgi:hypothetical protein